MAADYMQRPDDSQPRGTASGPVTDVLVMCSRPVGLAASEADEWLREELAMLLLDDTITRIQVTTLTGVLPAEGPPWDYLIRITVEGADARDAVRAPACDCLLGDLRLLGMRPYVVGDNKRTVTLTRGDA